jgi:flagellar biosynthesis regulator FlaF
LNVTVDARHRHLTARTIALSAAQRPDQYIADALDFEMRRSSSLFLSVDLARDENHLPEPRSRKGARAERARVGVFDASKRP